MRRPKPTAESRERARRIAAALADHLVEAPDPSPRSGTGTLVCPACGHLGMDDLRHDAQVQMSQCPHCGGTFLASEALDGALRTEQAPAQPLPATELRERGQALVPPSPEVAYRHCPVCREVMGRRNFARVSGVVIDECTKHGVFLDDGELEALQAFVAGGGLALAAQRAREQAAAASSRRRREIDDLRRERDKLAQDRAARSVLWTFFGPY